MNKIIHQRVQLPCDSHRAFNMFTDKHLLESWLTSVAEIEPVAGGKYELFWEPNDRENNSTIGCKVTAVDSDKFIAFEWRSSPEWKEARQWQERAWQVAFQELKKQVSDSRY